MNDIFLSYSRDDESMAKILARSLMNAGWSVWWDPQIRAGEPFDRVIENEISQSKCVIVLWSRSSVESNWVRAEAAEGLRRELLIPIMIEDSIVLPLQFTHIHTIPLSKWRGNSRSNDFRRLLDDIEAKVGPPLTSEIESSNTELLSSDSSADVHEIDRSVIVGALIGTTFGAVGTIIVGYGSDSWIWQFALVDGIAGIISGLIIGRNQKIFFAALVGSCIGAVVGLVWAYVAFAYAAGLAWGWGVGAVIGAIVGASNADNPGDTSQ